ncbi:hypothetical protein B0H11DRAFT_1985050 [Mycena galericulata]|nr:hypothetical protein B0H11DRAFT_1985050 [Mycena galericulata]
MSARKEESQTILDITCTRLASKRLPRSAPAGHTHFLPTFFQLDLMGYSTVSVDQDSKLAILVTLVSLFWVARARLSRVWLNDHLSGWQHEQKGQRACPYNTRKIQLLWYCDLAWRLLLVATIQVFDRARFFWYEHAFAFHYNIFLGLLHAGVGVHGKCCG